MQKKNLILFINTVPRDYRHHMGPYINALKDAGIRVVLISTGSPECLTNLIDIDVDYYDCGITRKPNLISDFIALIKIFKLIVKIKPDVVHTISPKAGLLGAIAGFFSFTSIRIHTFTGQVWANKRGFARLALKSFDKIICLLCTQLLADSESQKEFLIQNGVVTPRKISVLGHGSICGVDQERFHRNDEVRNYMRAKFCIKKSDVVFLFMGRVNRDKGIYDLIKAFKELKNCGSKAWLCIVGMCEDENLLNRLLDYDNQIIYQKYTATPESYYWMADVLCLPSYREGFGNVIIEAAAASLPCMASRIYGVVDAVEEGYSGLLHEPGNVKQIKEGFEFWLQNTKNIDDMGNNARQRVIEKFNSKDLVQEFVAMYRKLSVNI